MRISSLFGRALDRATPQPDRFDVGGTLYAVGDVHGEITLLKALVKRIRADAGRPETMGPKKLVFVGDLVDRGENSRAVLEYLSTLTIPDCEIIFLLGNHEQQMLKFADDPVRHHRWLDWGGRETLTSFGVRSFPASDEEHFLQIGEDFRDALGKLRSFVEDRTVLSCRMGNVILSHGGMDPDRDIEDQPEKYLIWGGNRFMERGGPPGYWYVHGHIIHDTPGVFGNRIAIDTGAYRTGILTVARITDDGCAFLQQS
jgi:serine/threonine protein phosphatase 1